MKILIDTYYDVSCVNCGRSRSTDFEKGMETTKKSLSKRAYAEGWKCRKGKTLCPDCAESPRAIKGKCYSDCPHLSQRQEEYDDEPMGYCGVCRDGFIGSMDEIRDCACECIGN